MHSACVRFPRRNLARPSPTVAVTMVSPLQRVPSVRVARLPIPAKRPSTAVVPTACHQPLVQTIKDVLNRTATKRCSVAAPMESPLPRATIWRDARNPATRQNSVVAQTTKLQLAERTIWAAATLPNSVAVQMELR